MISISVSFFLRLAYWVRLTQCVRDSFSWCPGISSFLAFLQCGSCTATNIPFYVFPGKKLRGLSPNSTFMFLWPIYMYIPRIGPHIYLQQNRQTDRGHIYINRSQTHACGIGTFLGIFASNFLYCGFALWRVCLLGPQVYMKAKILSYSLLSLLHGSAN